MNNKLQYKKIIERGLSLGIEEIEVYASTRDSNNLKLMNGKVETYSLNSIFNVSIRGIYNGKMGYVSTEAIDDESIEELLNQLIENTKVITSTKQEFIYKGSDNYTECPETKADYNEYSFEDKVNLLKELESRALSSDKRIVKVGYCQYSESLIRIEILNSHGVNLNKECSYMVAVLGVLASDGKENTSGFGSDINTKFNEIEKDKILNEALSNALDRLGAGFIETEKYDVVFRNDVATSILSSFSSVFSGEEAMQKMTNLIGKVGKQVFGKNIQIVDDPFYEDAIIKTSFDDEAVPCKKKYVVQDGVFKGFLHDQKSAHYFKEELTGNGFKSGNGISPSPTNLVLLPESQTKEELISKVSKGIYVTNVAGLHSGLNPVSGAFNVQASGFYIENGKIVKAITLFVVSGNFYEMYNNVIEIANDITKRFDGVASPTILVSGLNISGK